MGRRGSQAGGETMHKKDNVPTPQTQSLNETEARLLNTLRTMGAVNATASQPADKIERRAQLRHGPMMHALRELERKGHVARIVGRKDVLFHVRAGGA